MIVRALPLLLLALLAPAAAAPAATTVDDIDGGSGPTLIVTGDGADNRIAVTREGEFLYVSEEGAEVTDNAETCEPAAPRVRCQIEVSAVALLGGGGNDTLTADAAGFPYSISGGAGDDQLNGAADDELSGDDGNDTLNARAGAFGAGDRGGPGNDTFNGNPAAVDEFVQEPGADGYFGGTRTFTALDCLSGCADADRIDYATGPVAVTLDGLPDDGAAGESDNVHADVDVVTGTAAADVLSAAGAAGDHELRGGAGDDALTGGADADVLDGGPGADALAGMAGGDRLISGEGEREAPAPDRLDGGAGDDVLVPGHGAEELTGGAGIDRAAFVRFDGQTPVAFEITLDDQPNDGPRGGTEGDNVRTDVEAVATGPGGDRLVGAAGAEQLSGGAGDDEVDGRGGVDTLEGGPGADALLARDGGFDLVNCGEGTDPSTVADEGDRLESCEAAALAPLPPPPDRTRPQLSLSGRTTLSAGAFTRARGVTVRARTNETTALLARATVKGMIARAGDYVLGQRSLPLADGGSRTLRMRFARRDVRSIRRKLRRRAYRFTVRVTATDAAGNRTTAARRITIRRR